MDLYRVHFDGFINEQLKKQNFAHYSAFKMEVRFKVNQPDILPSVVVDRLSKESALKVEKYLTSLGCRVYIDESDYAIMDNQETNVQNFFERANMPILCPRCGSSQITTGQRGYKIVTGFIGSNKTVNRCAKCGYSWKP
jgi:DNA-directed RNA polymerase subunit M/transcription elongation factor TFIIS